MQSRTDIIALTLIIAALTLYMYVTVTSPIAFGDEGYYASTARFIADNGIYPLYEPLVSTDINLKPTSQTPLFAITSSAIWKLGGEIAFKMSMAIYSALAAAFIYLIFRRYDRPVAGIAAAVASMATPIVVTYGVMSYVDSMSCLWFAAFAYFALSAFDNGSRLQGVISGVFAGLAILTKTSGVFALMMIVAYFLVQRKWDRWPVLAAVIITALLLTSAIGIRNWMGFGIPSVPLPGAGYLLGEYPGWLLKQPVQESDSLQWAGRTVEAGTEVTILNMGILSYVRFAFGWTIPILAGIGLAGAMMRRKPLDIFIFVWLAIWLALTVQFGGARAEDAARYMAPISLATAALAGLAVSDAYRFARQRTKYVAVMLVIFMLVGIWYYGQEKIGTMLAVKQFAPSFFDGCSWIQKNTPQDSLLLSLHTYPTAYNCNRRTDWEFPGKKTILLQPGNASYEMLKMHGFDYIYVQVFSLSQQNLQQGWPLDFVNYVNGSPNFQKIYDNTDKYGNAGVILYKIL